MNSLEVFVRLRDSLRALNYNGSAQRIFGNKGCYITARIPMEQISQWRNPTAWIEYGGSTPYLQTRGMFEQFIKITLFVHNLGDEYGEGVVIGRNKDSTTRAGVGFLELESEVINHLHSITALSGDKISFTAIKKNAPKEVKGNKPGIFKELLFSCLIDYATDNSLGDVDKVLRSPGSLYWNPVNLVDDFGVHLGHRNKPIVFISGIEGGVQFLPGDETTGDEFNHAIFTGINPYAVVTFLEHNSNVIKLAFANMVDGDDIKGYSENTGKDYASDASIFGKLLFVPDDQANNKILLLQKVVPIAIDAQEISKNGNIEYTVKFQCFRKSNDQDGIFYLGDIENGVLR